LGSTRVIVDANGTVKAQYNYYPFGKQWEDVNLMANTNRYTFSGKEKQTIRDLGWLDFMARMYSNSEMPIFTTQDPLSEKYYSLSPYMYCAGNPLRYIDPNGMDWYLYEKEYEDEEGNKRKHILYEYFDYELSEKEMEKGGYTHLGKTYLADDKYYSLGGAVLEYDKSDMQNFRMTANVIAADFFVMMAVNAVEGGANFWDKYNDYISTGSNAANAIANYMESSLKFGNFIKGVGKGIGTVQLIKDGVSLIDGTITAEGFIDATVNTISLLGGSYGAGFALMYSQYKKAGKFFIKGVNEGERYLKQKLTNPETYLWGW
jgi:RHS repeat-associated protein